MRVGDILERKGGDVVTIDPDRTVHDAIQMMNDRGIGSLVVTGAGGEVEGIITERDILRQCGETCVCLDEPCGEGCPCTVRSVMSTDLVVGVPDDPIDYAMAMMTRNRVRHLPIMDGLRLVGIISIGDAVWAYLGETEHENRLLKDYIEGVATPAS